MPGSPLRLMVRNDDFVAEVAMMGHGLQMWLQTMWFLARVNPDATVILDEPDVYMHPDLQRRLIRHLRHQRKQLLLTTHSVEIMSEVEPEEILVIDRQHERSRFAASLPAVQKILDHVGSAQNVQLARLWHARKSVFVEGKDFRLLCDVFDVLYPEDRDGLVTVPNMSIGGWGGWQYAVGSSMLLRNAGGEDILVYCVLDSDYHTEGQRQQRLEQARRHSVELHIWQRKEIENYFLVPEVIRRVIASRVARRTSAPSVGEITTELDRIVDAHKDDVFDGLSAEILAEERNLGGGGANKKARRLLENRWSTHDGRLSVVSGKATLAKLSQWSQEQFGTSVTASILARAMWKEEIPAELRGLVTAMAEGKRFPSTPLG